MAFSRHSLLQLLLLLATCISVAHSRDKVPHQIQWGVSDEIMYNFRLFSQYAAAAYCEGNNNSPKTPITCPTGSCPMVEAANAISLAEFQNTVTFDNTGFLAIDHFHKIVVLSLRGSVSHANWAANYMIYKIHPNLCRECKVHQGFWEAWSQIRVNVRTAIKDVMHRNPKYQLVVTGHSLGGAIATLAAGEIRQSKKTNNAANTLLVTFGSPRVGDKNTALFLTKQSEHSFRVTGGADLIPRLPAHSLHYYHMSPEYWISRDQQNPDKAQIAWITGLYNEAGNSGQDDSTFINLDRESHRHYFGNITSCRTNDDPSH